MDYWKPHTTVAAVIERDGRFLMVEEQTRDGLRLNQPAGHLDPGETLLQAVSREALEETGHLVEPVAGVGIYLSRYPSGNDGLAVTYLRFAFACRVVAFDDRRPLDHGIERALWLSADQLRNCPDRHRSPVVMRTIDDYLAGKRFALDLIHHDPTSVYTVV